MAGMFDIFRRKRVPPLSSPHMTGDDALQLLQDDAHFGDLVFFALDHGIASIEDGAGPLIPFVMEQRGEQKKLSRFLVDRLEECVAAARSHIASLDRDVSAFAFAYDGYSTIDGEKYDTIFVEAELRSRPGTVLIAQRYRPKTDKQDFERIGNPQFHGSKASSLTLK